jgi:hypothetical protein
MDGYLGFIEFFVVALFAMSWGVLELVGRRLDRKKEAERAKEHNSTPSPSDTCLFPCPRHPERQHRLHHRHCKPIERQVFVHQRHRLAEQLGRYYGTRIERRVFEGFDDTRCALATNASSDTPAAALQGNHRRRHERLHLAVRIECHRKVDAAAVAALRFIKDYRAVLHRAARPLPVAEALFKRRVAAVHVEITVALPAQMRMIEGDLNPRAWRDRPPQMMTVFAERERLLRYRGRYHAYRTADPSWNRHRNLVDADCQRLAVPRQTARPDGERICRAADSAARPFRHCPPVAALAVDGDIDGAVIERID